MRTDEKSRADEPSGAERRRYERVHRRLVVTFTFEGEEYTAQSVDLSKGGALFTAPIAPPVGTKFLLNLSDRKRPELEMFLKVMVMRVQSGPNGEPMFGVEFGDVVSRDPARVRLFLERVLGVDAGLIRVEEGEGEKSYVFSFDPIHQEGLERLRALQSSLFQSIEEMEEADAILSNFGKMPSAEEVEAGVGKGSSDVKITRIEPPEKALQTAGAATQTAGAATQTAGGAATQTAGGAAAQMAGAARSVAAQAKNAGASAQRTTKEHERVEPPAGGKESAGAQTAVKRVTSQMPAVAAAPAAPASAPEKVELPLDAIGDLALPTAEPPPEPLPPPSKPEKKSPLGFLSSLFGGRGKRGEALIQTQPVPPVVARNLDIPVVYRLGTTRFQGIATRLYCAGLKIRTEQQLPALYASVLIVVPLAGARKISQIEVQGDVTRVRAEQGGTEQKGIFEVRLSMRTDKMHLELYRALLDRLTGQTGN